MRIVRHVLV